MGRGGASGGGASGGGASGDGRSGVSVAFSQPRVESVWCGEGSAISHRGWMVSRVGLFAERSPCPPLRLALMQTGYPVREKSSPVATERMCHAVTD